MCSYTFIVSCIRSGSTILGDVLNRHPDVAHWMEPYFIWDNYAGDLDDDVRTEDHATEKSVRFIKKECRLFKERSKKKVVVDKLPQNVFRVPFLLKIFPEAKWIHLIRDGRDVAVSVRHEMEKRSRLVSGRSFSALLSQLVRVTSRQPFWRNRFQLVWYEIKNSRSLNPYKYLNRAKWGGNDGYGSRFPNWREIIEGKSPLEIGALQWLYSEQILQEKLSAVAKERIMEVRYEDLIRNPEHELSRILQFLEVDHGYGKEIGADLDANNSGKWKSVLSGPEIKMIEPIVNDMLLRLGYPAGEAK